VCLVIHKPAHARVPEQLLASAAQFNPHGFGIMTFGAERGVVLRRRARTRLPELKRLCREYAAEECVIHLRYRTHGSIELQNTQPMRVTSDISMVHNGTVALEPHSPERSDTWHLINDYLRPILRNRPETLYERSFESLIRTWAGTHNRFVFMDARRRRTVIINREAGVDWDDLWLSNARWFDATQFEWHRQRHGPAEKPRRLTFLS
jgi:hypothetical protein